MVALTTLAALKAELGITGSSSDSRLTSLITQVSAAIETYLDRRLERRTLTQIFMQPERLVQLDAWPVVGTPTVVNTGTTLTTDDYVLDAAAGTIAAPDYGCAGLAYGVGYGSPCGYRSFWYNLSVSYTGGYVLPGNVGADLPGDIERACLDLAVRYHHVGGRDPALRSETVPGVIEQSWSAVDSIATIGGVPVDVAKSLFPYRRVYL